MTKMRSHLTSLILIAGLRSSSSCEESKRSSSVRTNITYCIDEIHEHLSPARVRECLSGRRLLLLGDSTMEESMHDLILMLSGKILQKDAIEGYMRSATRIGWQPGASTSSWFMNVSESNDVSDGIRNEEEMQPFNMKVAFEPHQRRMKADLPELNIHLSNRFTGHHILNDNLEGVRAFSHADFQSELRCLLGENDECPKPDLIIVNSGIHDQNILTGDYLQGVGELAKRLKSLGATVIWKGTYHWTDEHDDRNERAEDIFARYGFQVLNSSNIMQQAARQAPTGEVFGDGLHLGSIGFLHNEHSNTDISQLITEGLLNLVC